MKISFLISLLALTFFISEGIASGQVVVNGFNNPALITSGDAFQRMLSESSARPGQVDGGLAPADDQGRITKPLNLELKPLGSFFTPLNRTISPMPRAISPLDGRVLSPLGDTISPLGDRR